MKRQGPNTTPPNLVEAEERLFAVEAAWSRAQPAARAAALASLTSAYKARSESRFEDMARALDEALWALKGQKPTPAQLSMAGRTLRLLPPLLDCNDRFLQVVLGAVYSEKSFFDTRPLRVRFSLVREKRPDVVLAEGPIETLGNARLALPEGITSDEAVRVVADVSLEGQSVRRLEAPLSFLKDKFRRLSELRTRDRNEPNATWYSVREHVPLLENLVRSQRAHVEYPAVRTLAQLEAAMGGKPLWGSQQPGEFTLRVPIPPGLNLGLGGTFALTLVAPDAVRKATPLPLVIALSGFNDPMRHTLEGPSGDLLREACRQRGWLLADLYGGDRLNLAELLHSIEPLYPIDRQKVFVLGADRGVERVAQLFLRTNLRAAGVALVGGGRFFSESLLPDLKKQPVFWGVGEQDPAFDAVRQWAAAAGATLKAYPNVERLMGLTGALPDIFTFFEAAK